MIDVKDSVALNLAVAVVVAGDGVLSPADDTFLSEYPADDVAAASFAFVPSDSTAAQVSSREVSVKCKHRQLEAADT